MKLYIANFNRFRSHHCRSWWPRFVQILLDVVIPIAWHWNFWNICSNVVTITISHQTRSILKHYCTELYIAHFNRFKSRHCVAYELTLIHRQSPSLTVIHRHPPSFTVTHRHAHIHRHTPPFTVIHCHTLSHTVTHRHSLSCTSVTGDVNFYRSC